MNSVVVTGAASGMGRSSAIAFVKAGWRTVGIDRDPTALTALADELGDTFHPHVTDVTDPAQTAAAIDAAAMDGRFAAVANIAGIYPPTTLDTATEQLYRRIFDVNVLGTVNVIKAAVPYLRANRGGSIINFASVDAFAVSPGQLLYSAAKAAVVSLTKSLAIELADDRIVVNCVAPGWVDTPGNQATGRMSEAAKTVPLGRVATPDEIADWVVHLANPGYMTGETIVLSGGSVIR